MSQPPERPSRGRPLLQIGALAVAVIVAIALGRHAFDVSLKPAPATRAPAAAPPSQVAAGGFTLTSTTVELPEDDSTYKGAGADLMNANCTACHSASMALTQPPLSKAQWTATVEKMRDTYKATVAAKDVPAIVDYLTAMSVRTAGGALHSNQTPAAEATGATG